MARKPIGLILGILFQGLLVTSGVGNVVRGTFDNFQGNRNASGISLYCVDECTGGKYYCSCPGDGTVVFFHCDRNYCPSCVMWKHCSKCRSGINQIGDKPCSGCLDGFKDDESGHCSIDINECEGKNDCDQICVNTYGSYYCLCEDGYKLDIDRKTCIPLTCDELPDFPGGKVTATNEWKVGSYARHSCNNRNHTLLGDQDKRCQGTSWLEGEDTWWDGSQPQCQDACKFVLPHLRSQCGNLGISENRCLQLGCCYDAFGGEKKCYYNKMKLFLEQRGRRPDDWDPIGTGEKDSDGYFTFEWQTRDSCAFMCAVSENPKCKSFGYRSLGYNKRALVTDYLCHMLDEHLGDFDGRKQMINDANYTMYFKIPYIWQPDPKSPLVHQTWWDQMHLSLKNQYIGCFGDKPGDRDLSHHMSTSDTNTVYSCVKLCRNRGFSFAGIQNGIECYCGNAPVRKHGEAKTCDVPCPEDNELPCGGATSNSIYSVSTDERYLGCYSDTNTMLKIWDHTANKSVDPCVDTSSMGSVFNAGLKNSGDCYVGNYDTSSGHVHESQCSTTCHGWGKMNCGGITDFGLYRADTRTYFGIDSKEDRTLNHLNVVYERKNLITGFPTTLFTLYQGLKRFYLKRFALITSDIIQTPSEDQYCATDCYKSCGDIYMPEGIKYIGENVTLRSFYIKLSDINDKIGKDTKRVYVYAQTVLIDQDVHFDVAVFLKTRQLIVDRSKAHWISFGKNELDYEPSSTATLQNLDTMEDLLHMRQSFICAHILLDNKRKEDENTAWAIFKDMSNSRSEDKEILSFASYIKTFSAELAGVYRTDLHFVPFYTKSHIADILETYADDIEIYRDQLNRVVDDTISSLQFLAFAEKMNDLYGQSDVAEAEASFESIMSALQRSEATYERLYSYYTDARWDLELTQRALEKELDALRDKAFISFVWNFVKISAKLYIGDVSFVGDDLLEDVEDVSDITEDVEAMFETMRTLAEVVEQTNALFDMVDEIVGVLEETEEGLDYKKYQDDIELTVQMQVNIVQWKNLKNYANSILDDDKLKELDNTKPYHRQMLDVANWGEALTRSMVERAEILREAVSRKSLLEHKKGHVNRVKGHIEDFRKDMTMSRQTVIRDLIEQSYDVRMDLNEALIMFCRSYFYANMYECKSNYKPAFGGSFDELLLRINAARRDDLLVGEAPSTISRFIQIKDNVTDLSCNDAKVCPVNYLRNHRILYFDLPVDHKGLIDLDAFKVSELLLDFHGAKATTENLYLKIGIESSGYFKGRKGEKVYHFLTRPLSLVFEYNIETDHISIRANVYEPFRNIVNHITPYTTWVMTVSPTMSKDIDLSGVTHIDLRLDGAAVPGPLSV